MKNKEMIYDQGTNRYKNKRVTPCTLRVLGGREPPCVFVKLPRTRPRPRNAKNVSCNCFRTHHRIRARSGWVNISHIYIHETASNAR